MPRELSGSDGNAAIASRLFFCFVFLKNQEKNSLLGFTSTGGGACDTLSWPLTRWGEEGRRRRFETYGKRIKTLHLQRRTVVDGNRNTATRWALKKKKKKLRLWIWIGWNKNKNKKNLWKCRRSKVLCGCSILPVKVPRNEEKSLIPSSFLPAPVC